MIALGPRGLPASDRVDLLRFGWRAPFVIEKTKEVGVPCKSDELTELAEGAGVADVGGAIVVGENDMTGDDASGVDAGARFDAGGRFDAGERSGAGGDGAGGGVLAACAAARAALHS